MTKEFGIESNSNFASFYAITSIIRKLNRVSNIFLIVRLSSFEYLELQ